MGYEINLHIPGVEALTSEQQDQLANLLKPAVIAHVNRTDPNLLRAEDATTIIKPDKDFIPQNTGGKGIVEDLGSPASDISAALHPFKAIIKP